MRNALIGLVVASALTTTPHLVSAATTIVGDNDCFGLATSCPDGSLWKTGLGGVFFTSKQGPGDGPYTDIWDSTVSPSFSLATPAGGGPATLVTRIAGVADNRGPWSVFVNGFNVGAIPTNTSPNAFQEVLTYTYIIPTADLLPTNLVVFAINDTGRTDGYDIDYVSLSRSSVPEPSSWAMMLLGFCAIGGAIRRSRSTRDAFA